MSTAADKLDLPLAVLAAANPSFDTNFLLLQGARLHVPHRSGINLR